MSSKLESDVCCRLRVAPSGESYGGNRRPGRLAVDLRAVSVLPGLRRDSLHVTCGLTACTPGSAPGPTLGNEYGKTLLFLLVKIQHVSFQKAASLLSSNGKLSLLRVCCRRPGRREISIDCCTAGAQLRLRAMSRCQLTQEAEHRQTCLC